MTNARNVQSAVDAAFANQVAYCRSNGAPITASVVEGIAKAVRDGPSNLFLDAIRLWPGDNPLADALPLRAAGGMHALHLSGQAAALAPLYRGEACDADAIIAGVIIDHADALLPWLDGPPQTNEAGRSANFAAVMVWLAGQGFPPRFECMEIGSSAGINLMMDRYRYELGGVSVGPEDSPMRLVPRWSGVPLPPASIAFKRLSGCDVAPVDLTDAAQALRLKAYVWPEHHERFERIETASRLAALQPPDLACANAADFVEAQLVRPQESGTTRMLMHSIVWQYVPDEQKQRITAAMERAGQAATAEAPIVWTMVEADRTLLKHRVSVRCWPGKPDWISLATAHAHGATIDWSAP